MFMQLAKGSWGLQFGAAEIDLVLPGENREGAGRVVEQQGSRSARARRLPRGPSVVRRTRPPTPSCTQRSMVLEGSG